MVTEQEPAGRAAPVRRRSVRAKLRRAHLDLGKVLSRTFSIYVRHLPALLLVTAVCFVPLLLHALSAAERGWEAAAGRLRGWQDVGFYGPQGFGFWEAYAEQSGLLGVGLGLLTPWLVQIVTTYAVFQALRRQPARFGRSVAAGLKRSLSAFGAALLSTVIVLVVLALCLVTGAFGGAGGAILGLVAGLALAAMIQCAFFVSMQTAVVEGVSPARAMARSSLLTSGTRWIVFVLVLLTLGAAFALNWGLTKFQGHPDTLTDARVAVGIQTAFTAVFAALGAVLTAVVYHDLRTSREGVGVEELVAVFE